MVERIQAADAALDAEAFVSLLTPDVVFRIGSRPELHGREAVRAAVAGLFSTMQAIEHRTIQKWFEGDQILLRAEVKFTLRQGSQVVLPYFNIFTRTSDDLISDYRIHIDLQPLYRLGGVR